MLTKTRPSRFFSLFLLMVGGVSLLLGGCMTFKVGGECAYSDVEQLSRLALNRSQDLELQVSDGSVFTPSDVRLPSSAQAGQLYQLLVRHHSGGGCAPETVVSAEEASISGMEFSPSAQLLYQGAFVLAVAKGCGTSCLAADGRLLTAEEAVALADSLEGVDPRSLMLCSPAAIQGSWSLFDKESQQDRVVACVKRDDGAEQMVVFVRQGGTDKDDTLVLKETW